MTCWIRLILLLILCISANVTRAGDLESSLAARYRYHAVNDTARGDAIASTIKLRLNSQYDFSNDLMVTGQLDFVHAFNDGNYNSVVVTRNTSPIPDPEGVELNELFLGYQLSGNWSARLGRQALSYDDERHIGSIEFWQKNQRFDAFTLQYRDFSKLTFDYAYVSAVQRIYGSDSERYLTRQDIRYESNPIRPVAELGEHIHRTHLFHGKYRVSPTLSVSSFLYLLENRTQSEFSSTTLGIRISNTFKPDTVKYLYNLEAAVQSGAFNNPLAYTTYYLLLEGGIQLGSQRFTLSFEDFGEDNGAPFTTSLATNHKFQGWSDIFTSYVQGTRLSDYYLTYRARSGKFRWRAIAHAFYNPNENQLIGRELDLELQYHFSRKWSLKMVASNYIASSGVAGNEASQSDLQSVFLSINYNL